MRTAQANIHKLGMRLLEGLNPATFIYRNGRYPCIPTTERLGITVILGGNEYEVTLSLLVRRDAIPRGITVDADDISVDWQARDVLTADAGANPPAVNPYAGRRIGKNNKLYRIIAVREDPVGSHWTIDLTDSNK